MKEEIIKLIDKEIIDWANLLSEDNENSEFYMGCLKSLDFLKSKIQRGYSQKKKQSLQDKTKFALQKHGE